MPYLFAKFSSTYFWYYAVLGLTIPFLAVFLEGRGFSSLEMGEILAIFTAMKIIGPTLWAVFADKTGQQLAFIRLGILLSLISFSLLFIAESYWFITISLALFSLFHTAVLPQLEVMTLSTIRKSPKIYARIRLWGSLGFVALAVVAGEIIQYSSSESVIFIGIAVVIFLTYSTLLLKQRTTMVVKTNTSGSIIHRILSIRFGVFFLAGLCLQISFGPLYSFFALFLRDLGYPSYAVGIFFGVGIVAEIAIFLLAGRIFKHFSLKTLLVFSILVTAFRWYITGEYGQNMWSLAFAQILHAAGFGLYHSASMQFIQQHFQRNQQNRGQAIYISGVYGIGGALGAYFAGVYWLDGAGAEHSFILAAGVALLGGIIALLLPKAKL